MQLKFRKSQQQQQPVSSLKQLFYPQYAVGAGEQDFLAYYEPLFEQLRKLDMIGEDEFRKLAIYSSVQMERFDELEKLMEFIVDLMNDLCTFCHRRELRGRIGNELKGYKKNLKNVPVGKRPVKVSHWQNSFLKPHPTLDAIEETLKPKLTSLLDKIYLEHKRIPNYYLLFLTNPQLFIHLYEFQEKLIFDSLSDKTSLPLVHKFYLGVIAASTYGSRYLWNFMVGCFLKYGGDHKWIQTGLDQLPETLKKFSQASYLMAYDFNINVLELICYELGKIVEDSAILEGFYILGYYQFLACVSLAYGLVAESIEHESSYLQQVPSVMPSPQSFETMKNMSNKQARYEHEMAREFQEMYSWEEDSEKENLKRVEIQLLEKKCSTSKKIIEKPTNSSSPFPKQSNKSTNPSQPSAKQSSYQNQLMIAIEQQQMLTKLKSSKTMAYIERVYSRYVEFDKRRSLVEFKKKANKKTRVSSNTTRVSSNETRVSSNVNEQGEESNESNSSSAEEDEFIYASVIYLLLVKDWNFQTNTSPLMESTISPSFYKVSCELLKGLRAMEGHKSKNLKMYYESLQNYMHEYISYVSLINEGLTQVQKNYIKLLTRSPFLFNERSFLKMKEDLEAVCKICHPFKFGLEVFSFKLEHSMALTSYAYYRYIEDK